MSGYITSRNPQQMIDFTALKCVNSYIKLSDYLHWQSVEMSARRSEGSVDSASAGIPRQRNSASALCNKHSFKHLFI